MATTGRKMDAIWGEFEKIAPNKAKCRTCGYECAPLVDRLKKHYYKVHQVSGPTNEGSSQLNTPGPSAAKQPRILDFAVKTTPEQKARFDKEVGRFFFANNVAFRAVESKYFTVSNFPKCTALSDFHFLFYVSPSICLTVICLRQQRLCLGLGSQFASGIRATI